VGKPLGFFFAAEPKGVKIELPIFFICSCDDGNICVIVSVPHKIANLEGVFHFYHFLGADVFPSGMLRFVPTMAAVELWIWFGWVQMSVMNVEPHLSSSHL
jgi:hypothetical protein